jgi:hypothetical protein
LVYLHTPAMKAGLTRRFKKFWSGPYKVIRKISELNYEIVSQDNRKHIVHINWLKRCYNGSLWNARPKQKTLKKPSKQKTRRRNLGKGEEGFVVGPFPLVIDDVTLGNECTTPQSSIFDTPDTAAKIWTPVPQVKTTLATVRLTPQDRDVSYKLPAKIHQLHELALETCCKMLIIYSLVENGTLGIIIRAWKMIDITEFPRYTQKSLEWTTSSNFYQD